MHPSAGTCRLTFCCFVLSLFSSPVFLSVAYCEGWEQQARAALQAGNLNVAEGISRENLNSPGAAGIAHLLLGIVDIRQQKDLQAIAHFQSAKEAGAYSDELYENWATALQTLGRTSEACQVIEESLTRDSSQSSLRHQLANLYLTQGKTREALPQLERAYQDGLRNAGLVLQLASTRFAVGQDDRAVELLNPFAESTPSANLLLQIGKLYFRNLLYRQAKVPLERAWGLSKPSYECGMYLALDYYQLEQYSDTLHILELIKPKQAAALEYHSLRGSSLARMGDWDGARRELEEAIVSAPSRADGYLNLGLYWLERNDRRQAWEQLEKGSRLMTPGSKIVYTIGTRQNCDGLEPPESVEPHDSEKAELYANLGESFHKTHHWVTALELFLVALEEDPRLIGPYGAVGLICQELGSPQVGRNFVQRGLELDPKAADLHFYLGTIQYALGLQQQAIKSYEEALQLDGPNPVARHWLFLGIAQAGADQATQVNAKDSFLRAREIEPQLAQVHYELGKWYLKNQELDLAEQSLERAIELDPHLLGAYYQYGLACTRNGKPGKGRELMTAFEQKKALRTEPAGVNQEAKAPMPEGRH